MKNNEKVLLSLLAGLAAGAVVGVLLAPHKGTKTRKLIRAEGKKVVDELCDKVEESLQGINTLKNEVMTAVKEAVCTTPKGPEEESSQT